jgi:hypothetical protein
MGFASFVAGDIGKDNFERAIACMPPRKVIFKKQV